ncbi:MAG TPA: hypothetical protein VHI13_08255 [Candidatus Kapabacteria bacterium]|nr:hypothetical protein [Candidatus Kapabacteria bacterium]
MTTTIRRSIAVATVAAFAWLTMFASTGTACSRVKVTNNLKCDLQLCLYSLTGAAPQCWSIPQGGPTTIVFPAGFVPAGAVSAAGTLFPFNGDGCTDCFTFTTAGVVPCCGVVCYDPDACSITINLCTQAHCNP